MTDTVYEKVRDLILNDHVSSDMLVERTLATRLGVSRTPVREALRRLEQDGLVERSGRGLRVAERNAEQILEVYEVRITLEPAADRLAALRRTDLDLSRLTVVHEEMCSLRPDQLQERRVLNRRFHECLWRASHNATLVDILMRLYTPLRRYPESNIEFPGRWERILRDHGQLLEAVRNGQAEEAAKIATAHIIAARDTKLQVFARSWDGDRIMESASNLLG